MPEKYISHEMFACLKRHWGYEQFRPWQEDTILAVLDGQDTLTILPTGGGKSLCFQLPALLKEGLAIVISPLISLMKDQVDSLRDMGIEAEYLNSSLTAEKQKEIISRIRQGKVKLLYISPERLHTEYTVNLLKSIPVSFFVIDEAHCISHWGHDFREDYRNLKIIKEDFAPVNIHAFTATATKEVQADILKQLRLDKPQINIASVDRPNLFYRICPRTNIISQIREVLNRHKQEAGIIYCLKRDDVDNISAQLNRLGIKNLPYHAGLLDEERHINQESFIHEETNLIVATVAFGMGIDRTDIRFIIHAAMPKSIEHYHQETGRAGRDGLSAHCYMFYGGGDFRIWSFFLGQSANKDVMMDKLQVMYNFCSRPQCRHKEIVNYFNQDYAKHSCASCDYCLQEVEMVEDPLKIGQDVLRCVENLALVNRGGFGAGYIANILKGNITDQISRWRHELFPGFGKMSPEPLTYIRYMIEQLLAQGFLRRQGEYSTLSLTDSGRRLLAGEMDVMLAKPLIAKKKKEARLKQKEKRYEDWAGVDEGLFELLRKKRAELAQERGVPAYIIFGDKSLKDMSSLKPKTREAFAAVFGVGEHKLETYAEAFISIIKQYVKDESRIGIKVQ
ncbi:MAG: DNA helicase RecQ [Candidatus Omnitrophota bacterium]|nr:DNA helicase RecQ [Candidatus Omnitrophota bacterium]